MNTAIAKTLLSFRGAVSLSGYEPTQLDNPDGKRITLALAADIAQLGYGLSKPLIDKLQHLSKGDLSKFHKDLVSLLKSVVGANVRYAPLFRKWPDSIPDRSFIIVALETAAEADSGFPAYLRALDYYLFYTWSSEEYNGDWFGRQFPGVTMEEVITRPAVVTTKPLTLLHEISQEDLNQVFTNIIGSKGAISDDSKAFAQQFIMSRPDAIHHLPETFANKENLVYTIGSFASAYGFGKKLQDLFEPHIKTATDVLRLAAAFSGDDVSLTTHEKKFKLSNGQRKFLLSALDKFNLRTAQEDMLRFHPLWLVLLKYLHVGAYSKQYPNVAKMADALRNNAKSIETFNRTIEGMLLAKPRGNLQITSLMTLLCSRPGDFARRLDHILRTIPKTQQAGVVDTFLTVTDKVASPLLLNLAVHMYNRMSPAPARVFLPKGKTTKANVLDKDNRAIIPSEIANRLYHGINNQLKARFAEKSSLGKVFIDFGLEDILVPTSMRDASSSLRTVARGSKLSLATDAKVVRLFCYWEDGEHERVDVDLSCLLLGDNFEQLVQVAYYNLRDKGDMMVHSGDFTSAPNGASEYIDVNINKVFEAYPTAHYVAMTVNSFTGQKFNTFPAKGGYMVRDGVTGKSFEAKTVSQKYDITAGTGFAVPMILDLIERKIIWLDLGMSQASIYANLASKASALAVLAKYAVDMKREKASVYDLLMLHAENRATSVTSDVAEKDTCDTVFDMDFAARVDDIMGNYI